VLKRAATDALMSRTALVILVAVLVSAAAVLTLGGVRDGTWKGLWWMLSLGGVWAVVMWMGGNTSRALNRLGLIAVAGLAALLAFDQLRSWIACGG
jgi:hypothetical protein